MNTNEINNLNETIAQALHQLKTEQGDRFSLEKVNLAELSRRTGISRKRLRNAKEHGFRIPVHGNSGRKKPQTVITGYTEIIDNQLVSGVTNSSVILNVCRKTAIRAAVHRLRSTSGITDILSRQNVKQLLHREAADRGILLLRGSSSRWTGGL